MQPMPNASMFLQVTLVQDGRSHLHTGQVFGVTRSAIQRTVVRFNETDSDGERPESGHSRATPERDVVSNLCQIHWSDVRNVQ